MPDLVGRHRVPTTTERKLYQYKAQVVRVVDGDTLIADVDLGFGVWLRGQSFRLLGLNAREHDMPGGAEAAAFLTTLLPAGTPLFLTSVKSDKYGGRYDATVTRSSDTLTVNVELIQQGWAAPWDGQGDKPLPPWPRPQASREKAPPVPEDDGEQ